MAKTEKCCQANRYYK